MEKKSKFWFWTSIYFFILLVAYEAPYLLRYFYNFKFDESVVENIGVEPILDKDWCLSGDYYISELFGNDGSLVSYVKCSFIKPWGFSQYIMFSKKQYDWINDEEKLTKLKQSEEQYSWGSAIRLSDYSSTGKQVVMYLKEHELQIAVPDAKLLNEISRI